MFCIDNNTGTCGNISLDLIIDFDIIFPDVLGDDQIEKLNEIL